MKLLRIIAINFFFLFSLVVIAQGSGDLDTSFNNLNSQFPSISGADYDIWVTLPLPDGKIMIGGQFSTFNGVSRKSIARLNSNGSIDDSFNPGIGAFGSVYSIILLPDGKFIIGGAFNSFDGISINRIARLNSDGSLDSSFNIETGFNGAVYTLALQSDGKILVGGTFTMFNGVSRNRIARLNPDGTLDTTFNPGTGANSSVEYIAIQPNGKIMLGGGFSTFNNVAQNSIVRLNIDGSMDTTFNQVSVAGTINNIQIKPDGKMILGGSFTQYNGVTQYNIAVINSDGTLDTTFNPGTGLLGAVYSIISLPDGKILIGGTFVSYNGISTQRIARLNSDGTLDTSFNIGAGPNSVVYSIAEEVDGKVIVVGFFTKFDNVAKNRIARINSDGSLDNSFLATTGSNGFIKAIAYQPDGKIVIGGTFTVYNGIECKNIARLNADGSLDSSFNIGIGANSNINSIVIQPDGKILIAGEFLYYNGISASRITRLNSDGSIDLTFDVGTGADSIIFCMALQSDGKILVGGLFSNFNGVLKRRIARLNSDGSLDNNFNSDGTALVPSSSIIAVCYQPNGKILIGGSFTSYNGITSNSIARLNSNGSLDESFNTDLGASIGGIYSIATQPDEKIIIGGNFNSFNGFSSNRIARLNSDGSFDFTFNTGTGANNVIYSIALQADEKIIVVGKFTSFNDQSRNFFTRLNSNGSLDAEFNQGDGLDDQINAVLIQPDNKILIAGEFKNYNGTRRDRIARVFGSDIPIIQPSILEASCNSILQSAYNEDVYATNIISATAYEFQIVNNGNVQYLIQPTNSFRFSDLGLGNFTYGMTYDVSVRVEINGEWSDYSDACPIGLMELPTTSMDGFCNQTMPGINSTIYFFLVPQATEYKFSVTNIITNEEQFVTSNERYFYITDLVNYDFDTEYSIKCQVKIDGEYGNFGPACVLTTPTVPTVKLRSQYCDITLTSLLQNIYANVLVGATAYKFKVENNGNVQEIERPDSRFSMGFATGIQPNTIYNLSVAMFFNNTWLPYGDVCTITTPLNLPTSQLRPQFCGSNLNSISSNFYATFRVGASAYRFKTIINGEEIIVERPDSRCFMSAFSGATTNNTYELQVAVRFNENWSEYGAICSLTIGNVSSQNNYKHIVSEFDTSFNIKAYPNPFENQITLKLSNENTDSSIVIYDMTGKIIQYLSTKENSLEIGNQFKSGVYLAKITQGQETEIIRLVKQ